MKFEMHRDVKFDTILSNPIDQDDLDIVGDDQLLLDQTQSLYHCDGLNPGPGQCLSQQCQQHRPVYILVQRSGFLQEQQ